MKYRFITQQNVLNITKLQAEQYNTKSEYIKILSNSELYDILTLVIDNNESIYYHEFTTEHTEYIKLFLDIDLKNDIIIKKYNSIINTDEYIIDLINNFSNYFKTLIDKFTSNIMIYNIDEILSNVSYTKSNDLNKCSYHIYFNSIILEKHLFYIFKNYINNFKLENKDNIFINSIDQMVYRSKTQLRFIYSKKENSSYYHIPHDKELTKENISDYSIINYNINHQIVKFNLKSENIISEISLFDDINIKTPYYLKYLSGCNIINKLCNSYPYITSSIDTYKTIIEKKMFTINEEINITVNFCNECNLKHKNVIYIKFLEDIILITKKGNNKSCKKLPIKFRYSEITPFDLFKYLKDVDYIRKYSNKEFMVWKNLRWYPIEENTDFLNYINQLDIRTIDKIKLLNIKTNLLHHFGNAILPTVSINNNDPHILQLNNGIYDLKKNIFILSSEETKKYFKVYGINLDYKSINDMNEEELKIYNDNKILILDIINKILPIKINNVINQDRINFERNVSSILYSGHKPVITLFVGPPCSGKSTIIHMLKKLLEDSCCELTIDCYTSKDSLNKPHAWKGRINYKLASFTSEKDELDKLKAICIKNMTERHIQARILNSNAVKQVNYLSQFIDMNTRPEFDFNDDALKRRYAVINFNSYFYKKEEIQLSVDIYKRERFIRNEFLDNLINNNSINQILLDLLITWYQKYHNPELSLIYSEIMLNSGITDYDIKFNNLLAENTKDIQCNRENLSTIIKPEKLSKYNIMKLGNNYYIVCDREYFKNELINKLTENKEKIEFEKYFNNKHSKTSEIARVIVDDIIPVNIKI